MDEEIKKKKVRFDVKEEEKSNQMNKKDDDDDDKGGGAISVEIKENDEK